MPDAPADRTALQDEPLDFSSLGVHSRSGLPYASGRLTFYERLIQYFSVVSQAGGTQLDLVNFNRDVYPEVVSLAESEALFTPEHGYGCPDGSAEMEGVIRAHERARLRRFHQRSGVVNVGPGVDDQTFVGLGAGTTGAVNCLVPAIRDVSGARRRAVVLALPQYSVYDGIIRAHGLEPRHLGTTREAGFLPTALQIEEALEGDPLAVIITYPANPAQTTYGSAQWDELARIARSCQAHETFLLVDNIYQDTLWSGDGVNAEIFGLVGDARWIAKVTGPSKDRPGASGWRIGYVMGDERLRERFFYYSSIQYNTPNSASRCALAVDLLLRTARLESRPIARADLEALGDFVAGWARPLDRNLVFDRLQEMALESRARGRLDAVERKQGDALRALLEQARSSGVFADIVNGGIGNVLLLRVAPDIFPGTCHELFLHVLRNANVGVLPANAFGFPVERGNAWFRITTIHDHVERVMDQVDATIRALRS
jgi:aspartate/methionine/tyrosine aminotransferase